ncbi:MAG: HAD family hydrolase [Haloarculaceae archaeon]
MSREYDAIVYDLDGTLVRLAVDWDRVAREVDAALGARGVDTGERGLWAMLDLATETGHRALVEDVIGEHEREGARTAERLPLADELPHEVPTGVVSLNCEAACRIALEVHGLDGHLGTVIGRDSVATYKPAPEPLLAAAKALGADPERTLFVGDSASDATAAERAGIDFAWARERLES